MARRPVGGQIKTYAHDAEGGVTAFNLFMMLTMAAVGAIGLDYAQAQTEATRLQATADAAAHAALLTRELSDVDEAKTVALTLIEEQMPAEIFGTTIEVTDIVFGDFDYATRSFTANPDSRDGVRVRMARTEDRGNPISNHLFKLVGIDTFDMTRDSVFVTYLPTCFREGFVAEGVVDIQSNNSYFNGFCIHSNDHVSINSNNYFEEGTIVSMPDLSLLDLPNSGWESNDGLQEAVREGVYRMRLVNRLPEIMTGLQAYDSNFLPDYVSIATPKYLNDRSLDTTDFTPGALHYVTCNGGKLTIDGSTPLREVVVVTPCEVKFGQGVQIEDSVIATTSTSVRSFNSPSSLILGRDDACGVGGGTQLLTLGGVSFTSDLHLYGSQIVAAGDVEFSANADGLEGASIIAGGVISGTSNMNMGFCGTGMERNFAASYFRLAF